MIRATLATSPIAQPLHRRLLWGASWGFVFGLACSTILTVQLVARGLDLLTQRHLGIGQVFAVYLLVCPTAGAIVGLLAPLAKARAWSAAIGILAMLPIGSAIQFASLGDRPWRGADSFVVALGSLAIGIPVGLNYHSMFTRANGTRRASKSSRPI